MSQTDLNMILSSGFGVLGTSPNPEPSKFSVLAVREAVIDLACGQGGEDNGVTIFSLPLGSRE